MPSGLLGSISLSFACRSTHVAAAWRRTLGVHHFFSGAASAQGVKIACGQGGCGACAVEVARKDPATGMS